jgi:hypothetical protein
MAIKVNLKIDQGADYSSTITLTDDNDDPIILTNYTGKAQLRKYYTSSTAYDFDVSLVANTGEVTISMSSNTTNSIEAGRYVYDIELTTDNGLVSRIVEGLVTVTPGVTRNNGVVEDE